MGDDTDHIPATYEDGQPVHGASTHAAGSLSRTVGLAVDHYLPGSWVADKVLGLNRPLPGTQGNTATDEVAVVGFWLLVLYLAYRWWT